MTQDRTEQNPLERYDFTIGPEEAGSRLDLALTALATDVSRSRIQFLIKQKYTTLNGVLCDTPKYKVALNDKIHIEAPPQEIVTRAEAEHIPLDVMYEDDDLLVVNKAAGMVVHPAAGNWTGTIVNALLGREPELSDDDAMDPLRPGIVHRLDKDTSGALVIAKTPKALRKLSKAFAAREVHKTYAAIVFGWPQPQVSTIHTWMGRHPLDRKKMAVLREGQGREAYTSYRVVKTGYWNGVKVALLHVRLLTGRTHQIRVHLSHMNYPLLGEKLYNKGRSSEAPRQMLHAWKLNFVHPQSMEELSFEAPFPEDFRTIADAITDTPPERKR